MAKLATVQQAESRLTERANFKKRPGPVSAISACAYGNTNIRRVSQESARKFLRIFQESPYNLSRISQDSPKNLQRIFQESQKNH